ncbi:hypothetical protein TpMuguga_03g00659 [Theileria parva strain Muguga]|uniref:DOT1 domain-containing protein n=1 Tax=Theileria parva TaxID=5875 RepID=Q4MZ32_THEPA|nr:uncharacterized protein TpMuguga_03g00659 [Theileria parva strain Muguga]EAN30500.1 hypothetical protein TpMuguga_03g00659 [Theileria parva strain Muguga]|eukprot:XP_762783.1 hypothetical protein [Theileria parva strain Muguga]
MSNSTTPRRTYGKLTSKHTNPTVTDTTTPCLTDTTTPCATDITVRKRNHPSFSSVESEFYRVFTDPKRQKCDDISFLFRGACNNIGTSTVGMYGEISHSSLKLICRKLVEFGLDDRSVVLDLGSGRGVPNFVFANDANTFSSIGVEKCPIAYLNSINNICIAISNDIQKIKSTVDLESRINDHSHNSNNCFTDVSTACSSCESCCDSPDGNLIEDYEYSVNTQLEPEEPEEFDEFDEFTETPTKHLKSPKPTLNTLDTVDTVDTLDIVDTEDVVNPVNPVDNEDQGLKRGLEEFRSRCASLSLAFVNEDIIAYDSFEGVTHFYSFDIAMERALISNMVYQFKNTSTAYVFASFISDLLSTFGLTGCFLAAKIPCRMAGSGEGKTCYIYVKNNWKHIKKRADSRLSTLFPNDSHTVNTVNNINLDVNNFDEPYSSLDMIKLSKMSLYYQYKWYLKRLGKFYKPFVTRSHSRDVSIREQLASERDALIEQIAHSNSQEHRNKLKQHIKRNFKVISTFP